MLVPVDECQNAPMPKEETAKRFVDRWCGSRRGELARRGRAVRTEAEMHQQGRIAASWPGGNGLVSLLEQLGFRNSIKRRKSANVGAR
jgi:hypothetical protein